MLKNNKIKGFSLIELVISISIAITLIIIICGFTEMVSSGFKKKVFEVKEHFYVNEAFRFLENELSGNIKEIQVNSGSVRIIKFKKIQYTQRVSVYSELDFIEVESNNIKFDINKISIEYENSGTKVTLLLDVEIFEAEKIRDRLFITIRMREGSEYTKCFDLKNIQN